MTDKINIREMLDCIPSHVNQAINHVDDQASVYGLPLYSELLQREHYRLAEAERNEEKTKSAREQAEAQARSISEMVAALECDYDRLQELREERKPWTAGWNKPGFLPDLAPEGFATFTDARDYIADEMDSQADTLEEDAAIIDDDIDRTQQSKLDLAADLRRAAADLREIKELLPDFEFNRIAGRYRYLITRVENGGLSADDAEELAELEEAAGECESREDAEQRIQEDPLSVEVRSGWYSPGGDNEPEEFKILLCTGGPAVQIRGELDQHGEPHRAWLEYQDWSTPWIEYHGECDHDALLTYCRQFYFGE